MASADVSYQRRISVTAAPDVVYDALTAGFAHWWTDTGTERFAAVGDRVTFAFPPLESYWIFEAQTLKRPTHIVLVCVESHQILVDHPGSSTEEWLGSKLIWSIAPGVNKTSVDFTHEGLTPSLLCYDMCEAGWDQFFVDSLKRYLDEGEGAPFNASMISN